MDANEAKELLELTKGIAILNKQNKQMKIYIFLYWSDATHNITKAYYEKRSENYKLYVATLAAGCVFWKISSKNNWYKRRYWLDLNRYSMCYEPTEKNIWKSGTKLSKKNIIF